MENSFLTGLLLALVAGPGLRAQNSIAKDVFTADPAPLLCRDTLFLYTGHNTASVSEPNYKMPDWRIYSTTDIVHWKDYGTRLSVKSFAWAPGDTYAAQGVYRSGKLSWLVATFQRNANLTTRSVTGAWPCRTGLFKDGIDKPLISSSMTLSQKCGWDDIDPTVFIDDKQIYLYWGNSSCPPAAISGALVAWITCTTIPAAPSSPLCKQPKASFL
jgi:hypothetical protein